jgi:hypothetical protein
LSQRRAVDPALDGSDDLKRILDLVEDDRRRVIQQKQIGFSPSVLDIQTGVEHHIVVLGKAVTQQRGLAHLARATDYDDAERASRRRRSVCRR